MTGHRFMVAINYAAKFLVVLMGLAVLGGIPPFDGMSSPMREVFATVVILFGLFRTIAFAVTRRKTRHEDTDA